MPAKNPKKRLSGEERRAKIIDAALDIFAEKGFDGTRTKEIAKKAGISETLVFQHFKSKKNLYHIALKTLFNRHPVEIDIVESIKDKDDFKVLFNLAMHVIENTRKDPRIIRLGLFSALQGIYYGKTEDPGKETEKTIPVMLNIYFQQRVDDGAFKKINPAIAAQLFIEVIYMYCADKMTPITGLPLEFSDEKVVKTLIDIFLEGLKP